MRAGAFLDRILFQERGKRDVDADGNTTSNWEDRFHRSSKFIEQNAQQSFEGGYQHGQRVAKITVRHDEGTINITTQWRIMAKGLEWKIESVIQQGNRDKYIQIIAVQGKAT